MLTMLRVRPRPGNPRQGLLQAGSRVIRCALGKGGIGIAKREGDGATPRAAMRLLGVYVRRDGGLAGVRTGLPAMPITDALGWCDAPGDRNYNHPVRLPYPASHERMRRADALYDAVIVLDWNIVPRQRNRGSAIFFHLARPGYTPTEGCVAISRQDMAWLLPHLSARTVLRVAS